MIIYVYGDALQNSEDILLQQPRARALPRLAHWDTEVHYRRWVLVIYFITSSKITLPRRYLNITQNIYFICNLKTQMARSSKFL